MEWVIDGEVGGYVVMCSECGGLVLGDSLLRRRYTWVLSALQGGKIPKFRDRVVLFNLKFVDSFHDDTEASLNGFLRWLVLGSFILGVVH